MINNISYLSKGVFPTAVNEDHPRTLSTAERLFSMAKKAEEDPEKYKYLLLMTLSDDLTHQDWAIAGRPSLLSMLGLLEIVKTDMHYFLTESDERKS